MSFVHVTITVKNMEESLRFYKEIVGLKVSREFSQEGGPKIVFLGDGETQVELIDYGQNKGTNIGEDIALGFKVDSLKDKMEFIKEKKIAIHSGPFKPNPTTSFFFIQDPDGLRIQFIEIG